MRPTRQWSLCISSFGFQGCRAALGTDEETSQQWLRVIENGVGMTEEVIKNYLTRIGSRCYRIPEFNQDRATIIGTNGSTP